MIIGKAGVGADGVGIASMSNNGLIITMLMTDGGEHILDLKNTLTADRTILDLDVANGNFWLLRDSTLNNFKNQQNKLGYANSTSSSSTGASNQGMFCYFETSGNNEMGKWISVTYISETQILTNLIIETTYHAHGDAIGKFEVILANDTEEQSILISEGQKQMSTTEAFVTETVDTNVTISKVSNITLKYTIKENSTTANFYRSDFCIKKLKIKRV